MKSYKKIRNFKAFVCIALVGLIFVGGFITWAGISILSNINVVASRALNFAPIQQQIQVIQKEIPQITNFHFFNCLEKAQNLISLQPWLEKPVASHFEDIRNSCFTSSEIPCEGENCDLKGELLNESKGRAI
jgi:hypothetical protein